MHDLAMEHAPGIYLGSYDSLLTANAPHSQESYSSMAQDELGEEVYCAVCLYDMPMAERR
jgi:hypothetical protein